MPLVSGLVSQLNPPPGGIKEGRGGPRPSGLDVVQSSISAFNPLTTVARFLWANPASRMAPFVVGLKKLVLVVGDEGLDLRHDPVAPGLAIYGGLGHRRPYTPNHSTLCQYRSDLTYPTGYAILSTNKRSRGYPDMLTYSANPPRLIEGYRGSPGPPLPRHIPDWRQREQELGRRVLEQS